jgi:FKBP-type peptidyl-prolyl cis-trans isomerase
MNAATEPTSSQPTALTSRFHCSLLYSSLKTVLMNKKSVLAFAIVALTSSAVFAQTPAAKPAEAAKPAAAAAAAATAAAPTKVVTTASGLKYEDVKVGTGAEAKAGQNVNVHYTGWLWVDGKRGNKFDSSKDRGQPFSFPLGGGRVIKGWDEGVAGMKIGGTRILTIPPAIGYGDRGAGNVIPPGATLQFEVELLGVQ